METLLDITILAAVAFCIYLNFSGGSGGWDGRGDGDGGGY